MATVDPGALVRAVESGNLAKVRQVGDKMRSEGWTVNWLHHAQTADAAGRLAMRNYLTQKASENKVSLAALKKGGKRKPRRVSRRKKRT